MAKAKHGLYTHEEHVENMQAEFEEGMQELDKLEETIRKEMDTLDKILGG